MLGSVAVKRCWMTYLIPLIAAVLLLGDMGSANAEVLSFTFEVLQLGSHLGGMMTI